MLTPVLWFLLIAPASAATPLDCTRTILDRARTIAGGNQTQHEKLAALSVLFGKFLDTDMMGREALAQISLRRRGPRLE